MPAQKRASAHGESRGECGSDMRETVRAITRAYLRMSVEGALANPMNIYTLLAYRLPSSNVSWAVDPNSELIQTVLAAPSLRICSPYFGIPIIHDSASFVQNIDVFCTYSDNFLHVSYTRKCCAMLGEIPHLYSHVSRTTSVVVTASNANRRWIRCLL